ncbi:hypothetical protein OC861_001340 [Tilletia horrida]|nr:hypothetical protein OC861_001340 [Tilletia horrida]
MNTTSTFNADDTSRPGSPDSQISANSFVRRRAAEEEELLAANEEEFGVQEDSEQPATQASIINGVLQAADGDVRAEERKFGRQHGAFARSGPELRALVVYMEAHTVFDPTLPTDERNQAWLNVVSDINRWNREHPRPKDKATGEAKVATRTVTACDNKWRKHLYPKIAKGETASQIASGPQENEDGFLSSCHTLKDQWAQLQHNESQKRAAARKAKNADQAKAMEARDRAAQAMQAAVSTITQSSSMAPKRLQPRRSDAASAELTAAVRLMSAQQLEAAAETRAQQQQQHDQSLRQAERARELQRQLHRDSMLREDRRLDLEEKALAHKKEESEKARAMERKMEELQETVAESSSLTKELFALLFAFIKSKF